VEWTNSSLTIGGVINTPVGEAAISGSVTADSYHFTGSGSLTFGGFGMATASVTLDSTTGLYGSGSVSVPGAGTVTVSGAIQKNGHFSLTGSGHLDPGGFRVDGSFTLGRDATGTSFIATASLDLLNVLVANGELHIESNGAFSGSGTLSWGGVTVSAEVTVSSGGFVTLEGSIEIDGTYSGYGIEGTLELSADSGGEVSGELDFDAKLAGLTVFSGSAVAYSSGKVRFQACSGWPIEVCVSATIYL
jgi:hypothetical protein